MLLLHMCTYIEGESNIPLFPGFILRIAFKKPKILSVYFLAVASLTEGLIEYCPKFSFIRI